MDPGVMLSLQQDLQSGEGEREAPETIAQSPLAGMILQVNDSLCSSRDFFTDVLHGTHDVLFDAGSPFGRLSVVDH